MKNFSFEISKRNVLFLGYAFILLLFVLNRFTIIVKYDKVEALYIDKTIAYDNSGFHSILRYVDQDTAILQQITNDLISMYNIIYKVDSEIRYKHLNYSLSQESVREITIFVNKKDPGDVYVFTFTSFWLPYIIIVLFISAVWALIIFVFFEKTEVFIYSLRKNKKTKNND
ncbi:MAG: hypothetical protein PHI52_04800 [Bacteroidales bacterium]|nr:hypothetical protein [Bacteroidales bacterium]